MRQSKTNQYCHCETALEPFLLQVHKARQLGVHSRNTGGRRLTKPVSQEHSSKKAVRAKLTSPAHCTSLHNPTSTAPPRRPSLPRAALWSTKTHERSPFHMRHMFKIKVTSIRWLGNETQPLKNNTHSCLDDRTMSSNKEASRGVSGYSIKKKMAACSHTSTTCLCKLGWNTSVRALTDRLPLWSSRWE